MKTSRRGLFGLLAGAVVAPLASKVSARPALSVNRLPRLLNQLAAEPSGLIGPKLHIRIPNDFTAKLADARNVYSYSRPGSDGCA